MQKAAQNISINIPHIQYEANSVLQAQNIIIPKDGYTCILGHSGSGKTTFLSWLSGILYVPGHPSPLNVHDVSFLSQKNQILPWKKVIEQVYLGDLLRKKNVNIKKAKFILDQLGMGHNADQYPQELSQGMKQRVVLARIIYEERSYILLDEPFSSLDIKTKSDLYKFIHQYLAGKTIIHVTHDIVECLKLADEVFVLKGKPAIFHKAAFHLDKLSNENKPRCSNSNNFWQSSINLAQELYF